MSEPIISEVVEFDMLEKLGDGTFRKKHPETTASQVILNDGTTVDTRLETLQIVAIPVEIINEALYVNRVYDRVRTSSVENLSYQKAIEIRINNSGIVRVRMVFRSRSSNFYAYADIRVNGESRQTFSEKEANATVAIADVALQEGDLLQVWLRSSQGYGGPTRAEVSGFSVYYTMGMPAPDITPPDEIL